MIGANKASERHFLGHFDGRFWVLRHNLNLKTIFSNQRSVPSRFASRFKRQAGLVWFPNRFKNISSDSEEFACKPEVVVPHSYVVARPGWNATLQVRLVLRMIWMIAAERSRLLNYIIQLLSFVIWFDLFQCRISGKPSPAVKWVLNGRIISNLSSPPHASRWHPFQSQEFQKKFKHPGGFFWNSLLEVQGSSSHQVASTSLELLWTDFVNISNASICLQPPGEALQHQGGRNCCR